MTRIALVTAGLDESTIIEIADMSGTNLVGSRTDCTCWEWDNPDPTDLATIEALSQYKGSITLS